MTPKPYKHEETLLDQELRSDEVMDFEKRLLEKIVGQDRAVRRIVNMYQIYMAGMAMPNRPIGNLFFWGQRAPEKQESLKRRQKFCSEIRELLSKLTALNSSTATKSQSL